MHVMPQDENMDGILDVIKDFGAQVLTTTQKITGKTPLTKQISSLTIARDRIKALRLRAASDMRKQVPKIRERGTIAAQNASIDLKVMGSAAIRKSSVTVQYYAQAISAAVGLEAAILAGERGEGLAQRYADFAIKKNLAEKEGAKNISMFNSFFNKVASVWTAVADTEISVVKEAAKIPGQILRDASGKIVGVTKAAAPYMQYLPWVAGALVASYVLQGLRFFRPSR